MSQPTLRPYNTETETAAHLGLSVKTLRQWRWARKGLPFVKFGGAVRYSREAIENFAAANLQEVAA